VTWYQATIEYDAYVQDRGEGESVMAIEQFVNSRMDPFDQKELYPPLPLKTTPRLRIKNCYCAGTWN
jgi:hypothetical protein